MKTEVYSWRLSADLKTELEREAKRRKMSLSAFLDLAAREWLPGGDAEPGEDGKQPTQDRAVELRQHLAAIVESSDDAMISKDLNGIIQSWNRGAERIFGYTAEEIIGKPVTTLAAPDYVDEIPHILERIRRGERVDHYETKRQTKDGRILAISLTVSPIRNASGTIIGASKVARDITLEKNSQEAQRALERELMLLIEASGALLASPRSEDVLRNILETANKFIVADAYAVWRKQPSSSLWKLVTSTGLSLEHDPASFEATEVAGHSLPLHPIAIEDVEQSPLVQQRTAFYRSEGIRSMLAVPLSIQREVGGTVVFYHRLPHRFTEAELRLSAALGNLAAAALGTAELYERQMELRAQAERAERQASFLAEAGALLSSSLEYETTLRHVAQACVPRFADWCSVDLVDEGGEIYRVALAHKDPSKVAFALEFRRKYPAAPTDPVFTTVRTGEPVFMEELTDEMLRKGARSPEHLEDVRRLGIKSFIVVPMLARGRGLGAITFVNAESGSRYTAADLAFAEELAGRAAMAINNSQLHAGIRESEVRFRQLANAVPALVWVTEPDGRASYLNDRWFAYTGLTAEQSSNSLWEQILHPEDAEQTLAAWRQARDGEIPYTAECRFRGAEGTYRWFLSRALPLRDDAGRALKWFGTSTDIHDVKEARQSAERSNEELRRANEDLEQFAYSASHDLKEPLRMIAIYSQMLQRQYGDKFDSKAKDYFNYILGGARRMDDLVQDLLAYLQTVSRSEAEAVSAVDAERVLDDTLVNLKRAIEESEATIVRRPLPRLRVAEVHLVQVFQNLIENAIKYRGEKPPRIVIEAARDVKLWRVSVHDNGIGIAPQYAEQIFGIFKRLHTSSKYSGTGIGLAICQRIVHRYGGRIWVESEGEEKGSTFRFTLPGGEI